MSEGFRQVLEGLEELASHSGQLLLAFLLVLATILVIAWWDGAERRRDGRRHSQRFKRPSRPR